MHDLIVVAEPSLTVNAAVVQQDDGAPVMVLLMPGQTFDNAVAAIRRVIPDLHPDEARAKVREALPQAPILTPMTYVEHKPQVEPPRGPPALSTTIVVAVVVAVAVGLLCVYGVGLRAATMPRPTAPGEVMMDPGPVVAAAGLRCHNLSPTDLQCTNPDGDITLVEVSAQAVTLDWSEERVTVRVFATAGEAAEYAEQKATRKLLLHVVAAGRYVAWGTSAADVRRVGERLRAEASTAGSAR